jgi:hypothetical protein
MAKGQEASFRIAALPPILAAGKSYFERFSSFLLVSPSKRLAKH